MNSNESGVTYLWILLVLFIISLGIGKSLDVYSERVQRIKEKELIQVGLLYKAAIKDYYYSGPNQVRKYPASLNELLKDPRHIVTRRYIRRPYLDPITGKSLEPIYAPQGGIWGVRSASMKKPIKTLRQFEISNPKEIKTYQDWWFIADIRQ